MISLRFSTVLRAAFLALVLALAWPAVAREATDAERALLVETIATFDAATRAGDMDVVVETIPPKVMTAMSEQFGVSVQQLRDAVIAQGKAAFEGVKLISFGMDLEAATYTQTSDGQPYALIPTEVVMDAGGGNIRATSDTLALLDEGKWYLVRVSETQQVDILKRVYPGFADVTFDPGTMEAVE